MKKITDDNRKSMIKIRGGYSEEFDIVSFDEEMQLEELSDRTRVIISNKLYILLSTLFEKYSGEYINCSFECNASDEFCKELLSEVFAKRNNIKKGYSFDWEEVFEKYDVDFCYLFGSYAKNKATPTSDVDLLISAKVKGLKFYGLVEEVRTALHKKVDVLDVNQLNNNMELTQEILKDGIKIYG